MSGERATSELLGSLQQPSLVTGCSMRMLASSTHRRFALCLHRLLICSARPVVATKCEPRVADLHDKRILIRFLRVVILRLWLFLLAALPWTIMGSSFLNRELGVALYSALC